jgi:hypothetical protein
MAGNTATVLSLALYPEGLETPESDVIGVSMAVGIDWVGLTDKDIITKYVRPALAALRARSTANAK